MQHEPLKYQIKTQLCECIIMRIQSNGARREMIGAQSCLSLHFVSHMLSHIVPSGSQYHHHHPDNFMKRHLPSLFLAYNCSTDWINQSIIPHIWNSNLEECWCSLYFKQKAKLEMCLENKIEKNGSASFTVVYHVLYIVYIYIINRDQL